MKRRVLSPSSPSVLAPPPGVGTPRCARLGAQLGATRENWTLCPMGERMVREGTCGVPVRCR